ncbi:MAG: hypothetical protein RIC30_05035 [Marinoscillum sp.]|uniref:hypothetical protein n=1 Tax=Marinoscillum sp. TaxID=2024838 RepID=UPI0032F1D09F
MDEAYNRFSLKASLILIPLFIILWFWVGKSTNHCPSMQEAMGKKLEFLKNPDAIMEMKLKKLEYQYANNLVSYEMTFSDPIVLEQIRRMIRNRTRGEWNRQTRGWEAIMSLRLHSGDTLNIEVTKIKSGKAGETHLYFLFDKCHDDNPNYSLTLGNYLEQLTASTTK